MQVHEKVEKSRFTVFFQWFVAPDLGRWEMKNCTPLWREAHVEVKMYKAPHLRSTFGHGHVKKVHAVVARSTFRSQHLQKTSCSQHFCEKVHAIVARSTFPSQNVQNTSCSEHFWKLRCRKSARRCGAKRISKSKCAKHIRVGALLEVETSKKKKCTPLWREGHFEVKSVKNWRSRTTFGRSDVVPHGRRKGMCTLPKVSKTWGFCSSFNYNHHYTTLQLQQQLPLQLHYTTLRYTNYITLRYTTSPHYATFNYTTLHYITLQLQLQLHYITLHNTTLYYTTICYSTLR